ncbi:glycosyltransferase family 2 protein [Paenibacillus sp. SYP-B3998]|uniref:Glucosyl-3-phosphoglycerate synthase n=1 Tax=Paenibacillus sp. SYP-B3998 TaxID=2678564 RepID=A0A6G3ZWU0_9BACL|nr:glycosyltransferase family 2 protein [Paenibacillus sp. SYP-B3998]NEW06174.1 glycosyltransferase family 2 protein [Paenibacillus sp. SYP-B3998]
MKPQISIIIPAWNEELTIFRTLRYLKENAELLWEDELIYEIIVVDDGSSDRTYEIAWPWADKLVRHSKRLGKGAALQSGIAKARGKVLLFLDADVQASAGYALALIEPLLRCEADMAIAKLPFSPARGGFGLVKGLARRGIFRLSGYKTAAPLSGQRAVRADCLRELGRFSRGFGVEVAMTIDAVRCGLRIVELDVPISHRQTGRDWPGFVHRGKQFVAVGVALLTRWKERKPAWSSSDRSSI